MTEQVIPRIPAKRRRGQQPTLTPERLGGVASALLLGDTVKAACASAVVPQPTFHVWIRRGQEALERARIELDTEDIEGVLADWINQQGGFGSADRTQRYWKSNPPEWWPADLEDRWLHCIFVIVVTWARGRAEQIYRTSITKAAQGDANAGIPADWRAAQFMLTHSFGWQSAERLEVTGADGGAIEVQASEDQVLAALAALAHKRKAISE